MPYRWSGTSPRRLDLWPYRSLSRGGFVLVVALAAALMAVPLTAALGSPVLWGMLPFVLAALAALWVALRRSYRGPGEVLLLAPEEVTLIRREADGTPRIWRANPYWLCLEARADGPVPHYLTLLGGARPVEIGAFLTEAERIALEPDLRAALAALRP